MAQKVVIFYNLGTAGWTETFYSSATTFPTSLVGDARWRAFLNASYNLRADPIIIQAVRISSLPPLAKQSQLYRLDSEYSSLTDTGSTVQTFPDVTSTDAVFLLGSTSFLVKRRISIRGLQDDWVKRDPLGNPLIATGFRTAYTAYFSKAIALGLQIRSTLPPGAPPVNKIIVNTVQPHSTNANWSTLLLQAAPNYTIDPPFFVTIRGTPLDDLPGLPRSAQIVAQSNVAPFSVTIPYRFRAHTLTVTPVNMTIQGRQYTFDDLNGYQFERFSEHKTGRPFGSVPGRKRVTIRAR